MVKDNNILAIASDQYNKTGLCDSTSYFRATHMVHIENCSIINAQETPENT